MSVAKNNRCESKVEFSITHISYIHSNNVTNCGRCFEGHNNSYKVNIHAHPSSLTYNTFNTYLGGTYSSSLNIYLKTF